MKKIQQKVTYELNCPDRHWYWDGNVWRFANKEFMQSEEFINDYELDLISAQAVLDNWSQYLPGVMDIDDYGNWFVSFCVEEVTATSWGINKWTLAQIEAMLKKMEEAVHRRIKLEAFDAPYEYHTTGIYGGAVVVNRYPALRPLDGMLHKDYPSELEID